MTDDQWREMKDEVLGELVNIRTEVADLREQLRLVFDFPLRVTQTNPQWGGRIGG